MTSLSELRLAPVASLLSSSTPARCGDGPIRPTVSQPASANATSRLAATARPDPQAEGQEGAAAPMLVLPQALAAQARRPASRRITSRPTCPEAVYTALRTSDPLFTAISRQGPAAATKQLGRRPGPPPHLQSPSAGGPPPPSPSEPGALPAPAARPVASTAAGPRAASS